jgi:hypothetical protein
LRRSGCWLGHPPIVVPVKIHGAPADAYLRETTGRSHTRSATAARSFSPEPTRPPARHCRNDHRLADGTSRHEIAPAFFQPSRKSHVFGWYTTSGS